MGKTIKKADYQITKENRGSGIFTYYPFVYDGDYPVINEGESVIIKNTIEGIKFKLELNYSVLNGPDSIEALKEFQENGDTRKLTGIFQRMIFSVQSLS
jgi:hypothetical protein